MVRHLAVILAAALGVFDVTPAVAQEPGAGTPGLAAVAGLAVPGRSSHAFGGLSVTSPTLHNVGVELQGMLSAGNVRGFSTLASGVVSVSRWYASAGVGATLDAGTRAAWTAAAGKWLREGSRDLAVEVRYLSGDGGELYLGVRKRLF